MRQYILNGHEVVACDVMTWARWFDRTEQERIVAHWRFRSCSVSTDFVGLNYRFGGAGPPLVFETMIFCGPLDGRQERYATWEAAELGHLFWCGKVVRYEAVTDWRKLKRWGNQQKVRNRRFYHATKRRQDAK